MRKNYKKDECEESTERRSNSRKGGNRKPRTKSQSKREDKETKGSSGKMDSRGFDNNPNWYFPNKEIADQATAIAFQDFIGEDFKVNNVSVELRPVCNILMNPCPGVTTNPNYWGAGDSQRSAINLSAFKLYTQLSAFTGRTQTYTPNDIGIAILAQGEVISCIEWIRRTFGLVLTYNMRNRVLPKRLIESLNVDVDDLAANMADYRMRFNTIITRVNSIPIISEIPYFQKCVELYQKVYLDDVSDMAELYILNPATTWTLDETSYMGGSILKTTDWVVDATPRATGYPTPRTGTKKMLDYLNTLNIMVDALLSSQTLNLVYADLLNYSSKQKMNFWHPDYLLEGYQVLPEFNMYFLLQVHNLTIMGQPGLPNYDSTNLYTPLNDVYSEVASNTNMLIYNPGIEPYAQTVDQLTGGLRDIIVDFPTPAPTLEMRVESLRFTGANGTVKTTQTGTDFFVNNILPDHYCVAIIMTGGTIASDYGWSHSNVAINPTQITLLQKFANHPLLYALDASNVAFSGFIHGDLNYFTSLNPVYLRRLDDLIGAYLYTFNG